jgi:hypothetical protein
MKAVCLALLLAGSAAAQTPFLTDDAGVVPKGGAHLALSSDWASLSKADLPAQHQVTSVIDAKWGVLLGVEFGFDVPFLVITGSDLGTARGLGDLDFSVKGILLDEKEGSSRPAIALSAALEIPTGDTASGLGSGLTDFGFNLVVAKTFGAGWSLTLNLGVVLTGNTMTGAEGLRPGRGAIYTGGLALKRSLSPDVLVGLVVWGSRGDRTVVNDSELRVQLGASWAVGRGVSVVASASAGWGASPTAAGLAGLTMEF